ncbi:MAG: adenosylmethionine--8-amino-7-oxononanoate transaminase [Thermoguttaceae bacterium]|nr:adenosylmethionine--8-amino-7-oxononanoate transaminase [Thermoguttaceae bacterium]
MIWRPYQQMKKMPSPVEIEDAEGVYLYTKDGRRLIDSISSWWAVIHGYKHPTLTSAIVEQAKRFSHVMLAGTSHRPVELLSSKLESFLPKDLNYCFFSDSGSVAVEVALKMALQYCVNLGRANRRKILSLKNGYHGDTFAAMEASDFAEYHYILDARGETRRGVAIPAETDALEEAFDRNGDEFNCLIVEPLLQCAGGMRTYDLAFLSRARELCDQYDVPLIFDEVATGFGRTGNRFVSDLVQPDVLCLGKALSGGYIGGAATIANEKIFGAFYDDDPRKALMHGPTFMGNPLFCAASLASISLFESENYLEKIANIERITRREIGDFQDDRVRETRILGGVVCLETRDASVLDGYREFALDRGVFARPFLNYLYAAVPYVIEEEELVRVLDCMKEWFSR